MRMGFHGRRLTTADSQEITDLRRNFLRLRPSVGQYRSESGGDHPSCAPAIAAIRVTRIFVAAQAFWSGFRQDDRSGILVT
jgi:hypothetical protein